MTKCPWPERSWGTQTSSVGGVFKFQKRFRPEKRGKVGRPPSPWGKLCRNRRLPLEEMCKHCRNPKSKQTCVHPLRTELQFADSASSKVQALLVRPA